MTCPLSNSESIHHFAHISDIHLPPPSLSWPSFFNKRLLSYILWQTRRRHVHSEKILNKLLQTILEHKELNALLITGDQTNFGTKEEYLQICSWLHKIPLPCHIIPGNHDFMTYTPPEKSTKLWQAWTGKNFPYVKLYSKIAIIGVNSAIPALPFMAYGYVKKRQRERLAALLEYYGKKDYCRVIMIHHPPGKNLLPPQKSLFGLDNFASLLKKYNVELVLHGHSHHATITKIDGTDIPLLGVSAASMKSDRFEKISSWNHLTFSEEKHYWNIQNIRRNYLGEILEKTLWQRPKNTNNVII